MKLKVQCNAAVFGYEEDLFMALNCNEKTT